MAQDGGTHEVPIEIQLAALNLKLDAIVEHMASQPRLGRPPKVGDCVKGKDPGGCVEGSTYRYQQGCHGDACRAKNYEFYDEWRKANQPSTNGKKPRARGKAAPAPEPVVVAAPVRKRVVKKVAR